LNSFWYPMMNNPFSSKQFVKIWLKHFNNSKPARVFDCIDNVEFIKKGFLSYYVNVGENLSKGMHYSINKNGSDFNNKTFLIYDVPTYFDIKEHISSSKLKVKKIFQYHGFLMNLDEFESAETYINSRFSGKNRREFRSNQRRLETCFNIRYEFFHKQINKKLYKTLFNQFHELLVNRFSEKQTDYHHLGSSKWNYYSELVYVLLNEGMASLLVIYKDESPIGITLNFHEDDILFEAITVFDPDYYKFSIGKSSIIKLLEWCFENNVKISDFSKGDFEYKHKWANVKYDFNYHILYDSGSIIAVIKANLLQGYFKFKNTLRKNNVNNVYRKMRFLSNSSGRKSKKEKLDFKIEKIDDVTVGHDYEPISYNRSDTAFLKKFVYTFLFANPQPESEIEVFKHNELKSYIIKGPSKAQKITFS